MTRRITTVLLGTISMLALAVPAFADSGSIEEVVVTASKRTETVKEVPMAVTVIGEKQLDRTVARSFEDYVATVPGLNLQAEDPSHTQLIIRGINAGGDATAVGTYLDESPYQSSSSLANGVNTAPNLDTFDMARIEVLRGPQGTLYGASAMGGLLKFVTNAPDTSGFDDKFEFGASTADHGNTGWSARGMVNFALADDLAVRVVGFDQTTPGYIDDPSRGKSNINDVKSVGGRASVLWTPTSKLSIRVSALAQNLHSDGDSDEDVEFVGDHFRPVYGNYEQAREIGTPDGARYYLYNATIDWNLDWATLTSATSFSLLHGFQIEDSTAEPSTAHFPLDAFLAQKKFTQELRLTSPSNGDPFEWQAGFYFTHETGALMQQIVLTPHGTVLGFVALDSRYIETAGFANATYHFSPQFDISLGGRYSHNSQASTEFGLVSAGGSSQDNVFTWSAAARYHLDDASVLYARVATGYRPGGPNDLPPGPIPPGVPKQFSADTLTNYELGVKTDFLDGRLSLDADVFLIDWDKIQLLTVIEGYGVNGNGGTARSEGAELSAEWRPIDQLTISLNGAYIDAYLTQDTTPYVGGLKGNALPWAPKWTSTLAAEYEFDPMGDFTPYIGASWKYVDTRKTDFTPVVVVPVVVTPYNQYVVPSYNQVDLHVGVEWKNWSLEVYGKNLTDAKGIMGFGTTGASAASENADHTPYPTASVMAPRTFGILLTGKI